MRIEVAEGVLHVRHMCSRKKGPTIIFRNNHQDVSRYGNHRSEGTCHLHRELSATHSQHLGKGIEDMAKKANKRSHRL